MMAHLVLSFSLLGSINLSTGSLWAQTKSTISGTASTSGPCSPATIGGDVKNQPTCTLITNRYQITKIYQQSKTVTIVLDPVQLEFIITEVSRRVREQLQSPGNAYTSISAVFEKTMASYAEPETSAPVSVSDAAVIAPGSDPAVNNATTQSPVYAFSSSNGPTALSSPIAQPLAGSDRSGEANSFAGLPWKPESGSSTAIGTIFGWETDKLVKIDAVGLTSSAIQQMPLANSFAPTTEVAGLLHLGSDGSVEIKASSSTFLSSAIQFPQSSTFALGAAGDYLGDPKFFPTSAILLVDHDGGVKLDGIPLRMESTSSLATNTSFGSLSQIVGDMATASQSWLYPAPLNPSSLIDSNGGVGSTVASWPVCSAGNLISVSMSGVVTPCSISTPAK